MVAKLMLSIQPVDHLDRAISYGESCFETVASIQGCVFDWPRHLQRFIRGCAQLGIVLDDDEQAQITAALYSAIPKCSSLIRITITPGIAPWGMVSQGDCTRLFIQSHPQTPRPSVRIISMNHPNGERIIDAKFSSDYGMMLRLGGRAILEQGAMPLLWHHNRICCAASANIALHIDGKWLTPESHKGGVLPGVIRHHLLAAGAITTHPCDRATAAHCDAIVLLNSGGLIQEVASIDGRELIHPEAIPPLRQALRTIIQQNQ